MKPFTFYRQVNTMDCGPTCLRMIARYYGKHFTAESLRHMTGFSKQGVSLLGISDTAEKIGFRTRGVKISMSQLKEVQTPCIIHWNQNHFVVLISMSSKRVRLADPERGMTTYSITEFQMNWSSAVNSEGEMLGIALLLEPTPSFYEQTEDGESKLDWSLVLQYLKAAKLQIGQVFVALFIISGLQLTFPFLTQSIVDIGINTQNIQYIVIVLVAQLMLIFSQSIVGFIQSRLLLRISSILNLQILSDFWIKLTRLPVSYFDIRHTGDTLQRINDHSRIQNFLTGSALGSVFSFFTFVVYAVVLMMYSVNLFFVFCIGSSFYFGWVHLFLKLRRKINYDTFHLLAKENNATLQMIQGMQEIRINTAEKRKRWEWENIQANIFKLSFKSLNYSQAQSAGALFISQIQGVVTSFIVARMVVEGSLTLGAMLAVQYIIGQLNAPIQQWISFVQNLQDAKISMERLNEIHKLEDEEKITNSYLKHLPENKSIHLDHVSFKYPGAQEKFILNDIDLVIPENKVTAIVGASGSGKTSLIKLLLKVYGDYSGEIRIGCSNLEAPSKVGVRFDHISHQYWRGISGAVLQDGYIFNDTIAGNISVSGEEMDYAKLIHCCKIANIHSFIEDLPHGYFTKLGVEGIGLSQGQKQRILIARAIYKDPEYLFLDEATNALDAKNEKDIVMNLEDYFKGKTVVVVAHRLSTVKNADKIVVLEGGKIVEEGNHIELAACKGKYYDLVKNQLDLSNIS